MSHIAVIDIGKTNAKLALVCAETLQETAVVTRPNAVRPGPPWPGFDLEGLWSFVVQGLARFRQDHVIAGISVTTHGAAAVLLDDKGALAAPMLDYEHPGPGDVAAEYDALRPDFTETGSPRLGLGLNLGAQLHWQFRADPGLRARTRHVVTYPQYWGARLTGEVACDVCSLGAHTDLWNPWQGRFSPLVADLGLEGILAPPRLPSDRLGGLSAAVAALTGIAQGTPVSVGIHDSNASLLPHLVSRSGSFAVVSTGTWAISMAIGSAAPALDPARDVLVNVNALGQPVPSARFMGGREYQMAAQGLAEGARTQDRVAALSGGLMLMPAVEPGSGPFAGRKAEWRGRAAGDGAARVALGWYLALMTDTCLSLVGAQGPVIVEGPFARNRDYLDMLAALRPEGVETAASATGTTIGAAMLMVDRRPAAATALHRSETDPAALRPYAESWRRG